MKKAVKHLMTFALVAVCAAAMAQGPTRVNGKIASVDAANKSFVVTTKDGEETVKVDDSTKLMSQKIVTIADVKDGDFISVSGAPAEGSVDEVKSITILAAPGKARSTEKGASGTAKVADGKVSVDVDGSVLELKPTEKCMVSKISEGSFEDVKEGAGAVCAMGEEGVAKSVTIREMPAKPAKKKKAAEGEGEGAAE